MRCRCAKIPRGFTLLELVLVMGVIAMMFALIAPSLANFATGRKTHNAANQVVAMAKYARFQAIQDGRTYRMTINASARTISLAAQDGSQFVETASSLGNEIKFDESLNLRTDLSPQQSGATYVDFHSDGRTGDGPVHIWLSDKQGRVIELACQSPTELFHVLSPEETTNQ